MNSLLETQTFLCSALQADALLSLAYTVACLDPIAFDEDVDDFIEGDLHGTLNFALRITRQNFPDQYVRAVEALRTGTSYAEVDSLICDDLQRRGIPAESIEFLPFGIPLPAYGTTLEDPEFYVSHPAYLPVLELFGILLSTDKNHVEVPARAYHAAERIASSLIEHEEATYQQVGWFIASVFGCSGNSSIDYDLDTQNEFESLSWDRHDVEFALAIIEEADELMQKAMAGLQFLTEKPDLMEAIQRNVQRIYTAIEKHKDSRQTFTVQLKW